MKAVRLLAASVLIVIPSTMMAQEVALSPEHSVRGLPGVPGVPVATPWPELAVAPELAMASGLALTSNEVPTPDTTTVRRPQPNVFVTLAGASLGSFGGFMGGAYVGNALTYHGDGEYDGLVGVLVGGGLGAVLGSAVLGASMSGAPASEVFEDAFAGSFIGLMGGAAGAFAGGLTQHPVDAFVGFFLGHGAATTLAVMNSDYFHRTNPD